MEKVFEIYIKTTPEKLWDAITAPGGMARLFAPPGVDVELPQASSEVVESDPPRRLVQRRRPSGARR